MRFGVVVFSFLMLFACHDSRRRVSRDAAMDQDAAPPAEDLGPSDGGEAPDLGDPDLGTPDLGRDLGSPECTTGSECALGEACIGGECVPDGGGGGGCTNTCIDAYDGWCDDGGPGSDWSICELGTDCADCGPR